MVASLPADIPGRGEQSGDTEISRRAYADEIRALRKL